DDGANFLLTNVTTTVLAEADQWGHCAGTACDEDTIRASDVVSPVPGNANVALVEPGAPFDGARAGAPAIASISPARPRAGEIVRIYGSNFDAINGNPTRGASCESVTLPACSTEMPCPTGPCVAGACPCSIDNSAVRARNQVTAQTPNP